MKKNKFFDMDLEKWIIKAWDSVSPCSKKSFFWMFAIINIVFLWHTVTFFFGNHDWNSIKAGVLIGWSVFDGRWGAGILQQVTGGDILPVLNNLFCFAGFCLAMIALAKYWNIPKTVFTYTVFGLFIMLMPYTHPWLQFVHSETYFWNILLIVIGFMLIDSKKIYLQLLSVPLFTFSLGCYSAFIEAIVTVYLGKCLLDAWFEYTDFKDYVKKHYLPVIYIAISSAFFAATIYLLRDVYHVMISYYSTDVVGIDTVWQNILSLPLYLKTAFVTQSPFIPSFFKLLLISAFPISLFLLPRNSVLRIFIIVLVIISLALSTQIIQIISVADFSGWLRLDYFCMPYIYAVGFSILLRQKKKIWKSLALSMMMIAVYYSALQDFRYQKISYFDFQREMKVFDDVISRIKANPKFSPYKQYNLLRVGSMYIDGQSIYDIYNGGRDLKNNGWIPFVMNWAGKEFFDFYEKESFIKHVYDYEIESVPLLDDYLLKMDVDYLMNKAEPWPAQNSVHIDDDHIYIIFSPYYLREIRKRIYYLQNGVELNSGS